jgi:hypothetical protein
MSVLKQNTEHEREKNDPSNNTNFTICQLLENWHVTMFVLWLGSFFSLVFCILLENWHVTMFVLWLGSVFFSRVLYFVRELTCGNVCVMAGVVFFFSCNITICQFSNKIQNTREKNMTQAPTQTLSHVSSLTKYRTREKKTWLKHQHKHCHMSVL